MRLWLLIPVTGVDNRAQILIGFDKTIGGAPVVTPPTPAPLYTDYFRRYLNDVESIQAVGPVVVPASEPETDLTRYLRRYLNDPNA